jgi:hypothetical protein
MSKILHVDCDRGTGHRSILDLAQQGLVDVRPCTTFEHAESVYWAVKRGEIEMPWLYVVDTVSKLTEVKRQDTTVDAAMRQRMESGMSTISSLGDAVVSSKRDYGVVGDHINRLLRNILELPCPSIFVFHQTEAEDQMSGLTKKSPRVQNAILNCIVPDADAIVALKMSAVPYAYPNGVVAGPGTRMLLLQPTPDTAIGMREYRPLPPFLLDPTLADYIALFGGVEQMPHNTVLFGPPKIGKTTFSCNADRRQKPT